MQIIDIKLLIELGADFKEKLRMLVVLKENKKNIFFYFLTMKAWIQKDTSLVPTVFEKILDEKKGTFSINKISPLKQNIISKSINEWKVNFDMTIGGTGKSYKDCYEVKVNLVADQEIKDYVINGKKRILLETMLYPNFLPGNSEVITVINVQKDKQKFIVGEDSNFGRVGISTVL